MRMLIGGKLYQSGKVSMLETGLNDYFQENISWNLKKATFYAIFIKYLFDNQEELCRSHPCLYDTHTSTPL